MRFFQTSDPQNYDVSFPIVKKSDVNGDHANPVFAWLKVGRHCRQPHSDFQLTQFFRCHRARNRDCSGPPSSSGISVGALHSFRCDDRERSATHKVPHLPLMRLLTFQRSSWSEETVKSSRGTARRTRPTLSLRTSRKLLPNQRPLRERAHGDEDETGVLTSNVSSVPHPPLRYRTEPTS